MNAIYIEPTNYPHFSRFSLIPVECCESLGMSLGIYYRHDPSGYVFPVVGGRVVDEPGDPLHAAALQHLIDQDGPSPEMRLYSINKARTAYRVSRAARARVAYHATYSTGYSIAVADYITARTMAYAAIRDVRTSRVRPIP